jgi:hypothetical protein
MMLYRSNISRVFHPHNFMISPSETPARRKSRAAVRRRFDLVVWAMDNGFPDFETVVEFAP